MHTACYLSASLSIFLLSMLFVLFVSLGKRAPQCMALHGKVHTCIQESGCYTVNLPISASIGNECVKGPCQDTIAALWACNVRPSIGSRWTIGALEGETITTMLISGQTLWTLKSAGSNADGHKPNRRNSYNWIFVENTDAVSEFLFLALQLLSGYHYETKTMSEGLSTVRDLVQHMWVAGWLNDW